MDAKSPDFHLGNKAKAAIGITIIKGLNKVKIPGITRESIKIEEFGRDFDFEVPTSASWEKGSIEGNYVRNDTTGQRALRLKLFANEGLKDLRLYENENDFWAPDLAKDPNSQIYVQGMPGPEINKSGVIPFSADLLVQGLLSLFTAHVSGAGITFAAGAGETPDTISDSGSGFITAGFEVGMSILIDNSTNNDSVTEALVTEVSEGSLTLSTTGMIADGTGTVNTVVHGGKL